MRGGGGGGAGWVGVVGEGGGGVAKHLEAVAQYSAICVAVLCCLAMVNNKNSDRHGWEI